MRGMVERVAMAMDPMSAKFVDFFISQGITKEQAIKILPLDKARAAIEAMRDPTDTMMAAGRPVDSMALRGVDSIYTAMIDAALND